MMREEVKVSIRNRLMITAWNPRSWLLQDPCGSPWLHWSTKHWTHKPPLLVAGPGVVVADGA